MLHAVDMWYIMIILESFTFFCVMSDYMTIIMTYDRYVTVCDSHM